MKVRWAIRIRPSASGGALLAVATAFSATDAAARERLLDAWEVVGSVFRSVAQRLAAVVKEAAERDSRTSSQRENDEPRRPRSGAARRRALDAGPQIRRAGCAFVDPTNERLGFRLLRSSVELQPTCAPCSTPRRRYACRATTASVESSLQLAAFPQRLGFGAADEREPVLRLEAEVRVDVIRADAEDHRPELLLQSNLPRGGSPAPPRRPTSLRRSSRGPACRSPARGL